MSDKNKGYEEFLKSQVPPQTTPPNIIPPPVNPDGYKEFAKSPIKLSPEDLEKMFKGHDE